MGRLGTSTALAVMVMGTAAAEEPVQSFYIGASLDGARTTLFSDEIGAATPAETVDFTAAPFTPADGYDAFGSDRLEFIKTLTAGFRLPSGVRLEAEVSYLQHDTEAYRAFALDNQDIDERERRVTTAEETLGVVGRSPDLDAIIAGVNGRVRTKAHFANAVYDLGERTYFGGGIGVAEVDIDYRPGEIRVFSQNQQTLAYQVMAGTSLDLSDREGLTMDVRYRLMQGGLSFEDDTPMGAPPDIAEESLTASVGYRFGF